MSGGPLTLGKSSERELDPSRPWSVETSSHTTIFYRGIEVIACIQTLGHL